jgi:Flp pilus assembly protein TadG
MKCSKRVRQRKGIAIILCVASIMIIIAFTALVVDLGYLHNARAELQRAADAAALSACWEMGEQFAVTDDTDDVFDATRDSAETTAGNNDVCNTFPDLASSDVNFGYISDFSDPEGSWSTSDPSNFNAVQVSVRRNASINGQVRTFFARAFGVDGLDAQASATAAIVRGVGGFETPADGSNLEILPFALDLQTWNNMLAGTASDGYSWNPDTKAVTSGGDGVKEVNLYPQGTGSPGNRGTVDIGGSNNSTADIARQIVYGISPEDMEAMGGSLEFDDNGELSLNGDTGISAGVKDELASIIGKTRIIPIFSQVEGPGNNADFTIVQWAGVRIMYVKLTGSMSSKKLIVQPAAVSSHGVIPSTAEGTSSYVYSKAFLVR